MRKTFFPGTTVEVSFAVKVPAAAERGAKRFRKTLFSKRPLRRLTDQEVYFLFQEIQLLLHFLDQRYNIRIRLGQTGKLFISFHMLTHFMLTPFSTWFLIFKKIKKGIKLEASRLRLPWQLILSCES